mgnify:CR=1 FL=1
MPSLLCMILRVLTIIRYVWICVFFVFQAEDGIRDLVRSRGLGDVYKRQLLRVLNTFDIDLTGIVNVVDDGGSSGRIREDIETVSYTHLTLPTSDLV